MSGRSREVDVMEVVKRPVVHGVKLSASGRETLTGSLCVSAFHLLFSTRRHDGQEEITMPNTAIASIEHKPNSIAALLVLKDFRQLSLEFPGTEEAKDIVDALEVLSRPAHLDQLFAFHHHSSRPLPPPAIHFCSAQELLSRWQCSNEKWRVTSVNTEFKVCVSYPQQVIVPVSSSDNDLMKVAKFRQLGRFPVLAYHHHQTQAVVMRCGQPRVGPGQKVRCREDVQLLKACLPGLAKGKILDARSADVAQYQMSKGGGVELPAHYSQWKVEYGRMDVISTLSSSLSRLRDVCMDPGLATSPAWLGRLEGSGWLTHISRMLHSAKFTAKCVHDGISVLVHGTNGVDSTLQVTSLAQLLLDPHTRTLNGFVELVEREWLEGGHPFSLRHGHASSTPDKEQAPVFLLFLDGVWQVLQQFPLSCEFNERLLHTLFIHSYYSEYGTFLFDNPKERFMYRHKTNSLWSHLTRPEVLDNLLNPLFQRNTSPLLNISVNPFTVTLWRSMYLRGGLESSLSLPSLSAKTQLRRKNTELHSQLLTVRSGLAQLQAEGKTILSSQE